MQLAKRRRVLNRRLLGLVPRSHRDKKTRSNGHEQPGGKLMRSGHPQTILLAFLYACFLAFWAWSGPELPDRVATHFDFSGQPNGWMSRSASQQSMLAFGLIFPFFVVGICFMVRFLPASLINVPNREYWLAPERREETQSYLFWHSIWFACLTVCFVASLQYSILRANQQTPPHMDSSFLLGSTGLFLGGTAVWVLVLFRHFRRP
jgi:uncharacterized membrane protein